MMDEATDAIATFLALIAPFALALFVIVLIIAYPWLLLIPLGIGYLVVKHGSDEVPTQRDAGSPGETSSPSSTAAHDPTA